MQIDHRTVTSATTATANVTLDILAFFLSTISGTAMGYKLDNFVYSRSKIKIRIVVQGAPYAAGQIVAAFTPNVGAGTEYTYAVSSEAPNRINAKIVPNLLLDPSSTQTYELELPICTPTGVWNIAGGTSSYRFDFVYFNPIFSGTAVAPSVNICTYMAFSTPSFEGLTLLSSDFEVEKKPEGMASSIARKVGQYLPMLSVPFPALAPGITLFSSVASSVGDFLAHLGFSKPPALANTHFVTNRNCDNYSQFDGVSTAVVLAGTQSNSLGISSAHGGGCDDELLISHLASLKGIIKQFSIAPANASGTLLANIPIHPTYSYNVGSSYKGTTPLAGVAIPFNYWTGDLVLTVEIVASVFHRCTLLVAWDVLSPTSATTPTMVQAMQVLHNTVVTVAGNVAVDIAIPWSQARPWSVVSRPTLTQDYTTILPSMTNGNVYIFVVNPLTSNGSLDSIAANLYLSSKNIAFAVPAQTNIPAYDFGGSIPPLGLLAPEDPGLEELVPLSAPFVVPAEVSFGPPSDHKEIFRRTFGESYTSIKQITSKLCQLSSLYYSTPVTNNFIQFSYMNVPYIETNDITPSAGQTAANYNTFLEFFSAAFLGFRGSIRHSFHAHSGPLDTADNIRAHVWGSNMLRSSANAGFSNFGGTNYLQYAIQNYAFTVGVRGLAPVLDTVAPTLSPFDFIPRGAITSCKNHVTFMCGTNSVTTVIATVEHMHASGDDATFVWFLGFPETV